MTDRLMTGGSPAGSRTHRPSSMTGTAAGAATLLLAGIAAAAEGPAFTLDRAALAGRGIGETVAISQVPLGSGRSVDLELERFGVTGPETRFVVGARGGKDAPLPFDPDRVVLLRGQVAGDDDSHVFLALSEWMSTGRIELGSGARFELRAAAPREGGGRVTMRVAPSSPSASLPVEVPLCGLEPTRAPQGGAAARAAVLPAPTLQIELAVETDFEFFQMAGADLDLAGAYVVSLYGAVSDIYLRDVNARVVLSFVRLWDQPDDLFNEENPLAPFRLHWNEFMGFVARDTAQFLSGRRDLPYGGAAYLSTLCGPFGYSVAGYISGSYDDPTAPGVGSYDLKVTAHELGHNCGTMHTHTYGLDTCNDLNGVPQRGSLMSYCSQTVSGGNANTDLRFHTVAQAAMLNHMSAVDCLASDCNGNGIDDATDIADGTSADANANGRPDECEDCNGNGVLDPEDIAGGGSLDLNANGVPDECEPDCNGNGVPDDLDIAAGTSQDLYGNGVPDECEPDCDQDGSSDYTQLQAQMSLDIDRNTLLDGCEDCDGDGVPDLVALAGAHHVWVASLWPDGAVRQFHASTGVLMGASDPAQVIQGNDVLIDDAGRILVSSVADHRIVQLDRFGAFVGDFVGPGAGGLLEPAAMAWGPDGNLYVASRGADSVKRYDGASGAPLGDFVPAGSGGLSQPFGLAFTAGGDLLVTSNTGEIVLYDGVTGDFVRTVVTAAGNGGLTEPRGLLVTPDDRVLVASLGTNQVLEYDLASGAFLGQFNHGGTATALTLDEPWGIRIGPDGEVYVSRHHVTPEPHAPPLGGKDELHINSSRVYIFDLETGNFLRSYVLGHDTGLWLPTGFDFYPGDATDCNRNHRPDTCDIADGTSADVNGNGVPDECEGPLCPADLNGNGVVEVVDLLGVLAAWGSDPGGPPDFNGDGVVDVVDLLFMLAAWGPCP